MTPKIKLKPRQFKNSLPLDYTKFYKDPEYNRCRRAKLIILGDILHKYDFFKKLNYEEQTNVLARIEKSCINASVKEAQLYDMRCIWNNDNFTNIYHETCYMIFIALDKSGVLIGEIEKGMFDLDNIALLEQINLYPENYAVIKDSINKRLNLELKKKSSELYFCRKCQKRECTIEKRFNRSFDEAINYTITCLNCLFSWNA